MHNKIPINKIKYPIIFFNIINLILKYINNKVKGKSIK